MVTILQADVDVSLFGYNRQASSFGVKCAMAPLMHDDFCESVITPLVIRLQHKVFPNLTLTVCFVSESGWSFGCRLLCLWFVCANRCPSFSSEQQSKTQYDAPDRVLPSWWWFLWHPYNKPEKAEFYWKELSTSDNTKWSCSTSAQSVLAHVPSAFFGHHHSSLIVSAC